MMRDYKVETEKRIAFIRGKMKEAGATGLVFGNSGGKDSVLVGILCKMACENTVGIIMPCQSKRNYGEDADDGMAVAKQFNIETRTVDLSAVRGAVIGALEPITELNKQALTNIAPRLRMITVYAVGAAENRLVAGTGNRTERYLGYFTKWGDGAFDLNPIADLTVREVYEFLRYLDAPENIINKAPSAGLFEGQTDEAELGLTYSDVDDFILEGNAKKETEEKILRYHRISEHKRKLPATYEG